VIQITDAADQPLYSAASFGTTSRTLAGFLHPAPVGRLALVTEENFMFIRKFAGASAFAGMVAINLAASAASGETQAPVKDEGKYAPIQSIRYDFGSKSMSGYFLDQAARCVVMLMVSEKGDADAAPSTTAARVRLVLNPGQTAGLDSEEGRSLNFTCGEGATALLVDAGEREKLVELQTLSLRETAANSSRN
jgi:hypothetical protein